jgi:hypothetical protein
MRGFLSAAEVDRAIGALAGRQYGVVSRAQLDALGVSRGAIERRLARGRLLHVHRGVYAVGHRASRMTVHLAIPVTTPARTLAELARVVDRAELVRAVRQEQFQRLFHLPSVLAAHERRPSRQLRNLIEELLPTQSRLEDKLLDICDRHGLPRPLTQQGVLGRRIDFLWPAARLVVGTDGWQSHATQDAFARP